MFHSVSKNAKQVILSSKMEPALGFEPRTDGLQNRSSTAELSRPIILMRIKSMPETVQHAPPGHFVSATGKCKRLHPARVP